jgi:hypothetical protein
MALLLPAASCGGRSEQDERETPPRGRPGVNLHPIAEEFLQGNLLPRSFIGTSEHIQDAIQRQIAERGVVLYDMAMLVKALLLYPADNASMIAGLVTALRDGTDVRSNLDFTYDTPITLSEGYFYKIIEVDATWLPQQTQPITGENAWLASALASVHAAYPGSATAADAFRMLTQLTRAIVALQTPSGLVRMAPSEPRNYAYLGIDYHATASIENNLSCIPVLKYMSTRAPSGERATYAAALAKLENAVLEMYNVNGRYFNTGKDLATGEVNTKFATDCQTWCILAFGPERLDALMLERYGVPNASARLLERTLEIAGVQKEGAYAGLDFYDRASVISFEWSLGFLSAAREVLALNENAALRQAVTTINAYIASRVTTPGLLPYTDSPEPVDTGHGWITIPLMNSLASSAWYIFETAEATVNPFDI